MRPAALALTALLASGLAGVAHAQPAQTCPAGTQGWVIRTSKIKPGQAATFDKALADQVAWYKAKGQKDTFVVGPAIAQGGLDPSLRVSVHMNAPATRPDADPAWNAFVAEFRASSDIVSETRACLGEVKR